MQSKVLDWHMPCLSVCLRCLSFIENIRTNMVIILNSVKLPIVRAWM